MKKTPKTMLLSLVMAGLATAEVQAHELEVKDTGPNRSPDSASPSFDENLALDQGLGAIEAEEEFSDAATSDSGRKNQIQGRRHGRGTPPGRGGRRAPGHEHESGSTYGNSTYFSRGGSSSTYGSSTYYSRGGSSSTYGSSTYYSRGGSSSTYGSSTYYSNGGSSSTYGNSTYFSRGGSCSTYGSSQYCN